MIKINVKERLLSIELSTNINQNKSYADQIGVHFKMIEKDKHLYNETDDKGCYWFCDHCGALMNIQKNFTTSNDQWVCSECGKQNDVSFKNIINIK